jgi:hypothetical protein
MGREMVKVFTAKIEGRKLERNRERIVFIGRCF